MTVAGDAGAGGSNLDYQVVGLLNFNVTPKFGLAVGWRYLDVDYKPTTNQFVYDTVISGAIAGFSFNFGGKPPVPPTASCSASARASLPGRSGHSDCDSRRSESEVEHGVCVERRRRYRQWNDGERQYGCSESRDLHCEGHPEGREAG